jgi:hypothetical protein
MKWHFTILFIGVVSLFSNEKGQTTYSEPSFFPEAPLEFREGILHSIQITLCFTNHLIIQNLEGNKKIDVNQIKESPFKNCLVNFCSQRNIALVDIKIKRGIPSWPSSITTTTDIITGKVKSAIDLSLVHILQFPQMVDVGSLCEALKNTEGIAYAHPPALISPLTVPNDTEYPNQWYLPQIEAPLAWDIIKGVDIIRLAIIDAQAVCQTHPDLQAKIKGGDGKTRSQGDAYNRHGTMVAGMAGIRRVGRRRREFTGVHCGPPECSCIKKCCC